ncbi:MAG TPA: OmpH family outer membrane protein [Blastocatellia bacterium]|nr:OmpH family outer membrane protein [Blastocatellia bacterium]
MKYYARLLFAPTLLLLTVTTFSQTPTPKPGQTATAPAPASGGELPKPRIAFINTGAFMEAIGELKVHYDKLRAEFAPREQELASMRSAIDAKQEQIEKNGSKLTPQQVRKLQDEIEQLTKEGKRKLEDYQVDIQKREEAMTGATYEKINTFLNKYVAEKGITIVFSTLQVAEANLIVYIDPKAEITKDFIDSYNKANPAPAAPQAANAPAGNKPTKP